MFDHLGHRKPTQSPLPQQTPPVRPPPPGGFGPPSPRLPTLAPITWPPTQLTLALCLPTSNTSICKPQLVNSKVNRSPDV